MPTDDTPQNDPDLESSSLVELLKDAPHAYLQRYSRELAQSSLVNDLGLDRQTQGKIAWVMARYKVQEHMNRYAARTASRSRLLHSVTQTEQATRRLLECLEGDSTREGLVSNWSFLGVLAATMTEETKHERSQKDRIFHRIHRPEADYGALRPAPETIERGDGLELYDRLRLLLTACETLRLLCSPGAGTDDCDTKNTSARPTRTQPFPSVTLLARKIAEHLNDDARRRGNPLPTKEKNATTILSLLNECSELPNWRRSTIRKALQQSNPG